MPDAKNGKNGAVNRFEPNESITLVLENEYFKIYNDARASKAYKVINDQPVPVELKEINLWKNRKKNPAGFIVRPLKNAAGVVVDYEISRVARGAAPAAAPTPGPISAPPVPAPPPAQRAAAPAARPAARPAASPAPAARPAANAAAPAMQTSLIADIDKESRIKFEQAAEVEQMFANDLFSIYRNTRTGRTFKVISGEVVNLDQREINMWKNRAKRPAEFLVTVIKDGDGQVYDYKIEKNAVSAPAPTPAAPVQTPIAAPAPAPAAAKAPAAVPAPAPSLAKAASASAPAAAKAPAAAPAPAAAKAPAAAPVQKRKDPMNNEEVGEKPTDRVKFQNNDTTELLLETEFCKFYKDKRASKVFKVIDDEIVNIEQRELNMWKNRIKNPTGFVITTVKDSAGKPFDYRISKINEDGTLTAAPVVTPPAPVVVPDVQHVPELSGDKTAQTAASKPAVSPAPSKPLPPSGAPVGAPAPTKATTQVADKKRVKFEKTETMKMLLDNEYFKIYTDSRRGATFKVINDEIVPLPQRELNMWRNRQLRPKEFAVKEIRTPEGDIYDYEITRTTNVTAAVETTSTRTNLPPVTERINMGGTAKRPNSNRITNCAVCNNRYKESELFLFDGKNICSSCLELLVREKLDIKPQDPVQKNLEDIISADEIYCTYSLVTNYPYLDDEFCVNICTVKRAAEIGIEDTIAQTIDEKGAFFDDLKRFGLKKIIVNGDSSHVYAPEDFDSHVKTEGVIAPKLYFKVLNFMQRGDDELRSAIAESFLGSKVFTYALNSDITEITDENADDFKPLIISDGKNNFCMVFTDFTEARAVGIPFKGLYEIETRLLADHGITHYIINPSSLGFIMNKSILKGAKPNYDKAMIDPEDERIKNIDSYVNPFDLEDKLRAQREQEKKAQEEKVISDIKAEADKAIAEQKANAEKSEKAAEEAKRDAEETKARLAESQHQLEESKHNADQIRKEFDEYKKKAEDVMNAAAEAEKARKAEEERIKAEEAEKAAKAEAEAKAAAEAKAKEEAEAKAKAEAEAKAKLPHGVPLAAAAAFANAPGGIKTPAAAAAAKKAPSGGIFYSDEEEKSPFDALSKKAADTPDIPSLDLSGFSDDDDHVIEDAAPASYYKPQNAVDKPPMPAPMNEFKKTNIYGSKQIAKGDGMSAPSIYESAQKRSTDFLAANAGVQMKTPEKRSGSVQYAPPVTRKEYPVRKPADESMENPDGLVINSVSDGTDGSKVKKAFKVSKPLFIEDVPDDEAMATPYSDGIVSSAPVTFTPSASKTKGVNTVLSEIAQENERKSDMFDLASLMYGDQNAPATQRGQQKMTIQDQAAKTKSTARALEVENDPQTAKELRDKLEQCYRDLAQLIADADVMYAEFDAHTRHILIDGNNKGHIFSEKYLAEKSVENFAKAGIKVYLQEYKAKDIFNMLFEYRRHGIQELVLDETAHWIIIPTDRISEKLDIYERDFVKIPVVNPELMFSMTTLFQKLQTKSTNPNKEQEIRSLEKRMIREFITARYILPMYGNDRNNLRPVTIDGKNGVRKVLVFSDEFEMKRFFGENASIVSDYEIVNYKEIIRKYNSMESVVVLNEGSLRFEFNEGNCEHITRVLEM